ncbi:MAG: ribosomal protein S18-alanine N-acetyltransferase [Chloroflexi bacterium]|nr:ribosomal protein S18-alanine N-acetyltransferase [Chloroflexota bacterium]
MASTEYQDKVMAYGVRPMKPADISQVAAIEKEAFYPGWASTPFNRELSNPFSLYLASWQIEPAPVPSQPPPTTIMQRRPLLSRVLHWPFKRLWKNEVGEEAGYQDHIVGYVGTWFVEKEAHIVAIAVTEAFRGQGIGELLLIAGIEAAALRQATTVTLEVRVSNLLAQNLYYKYGFRQVGLRKRYYLDNNEDAYIMTLADIDKEAYRERFTALAWQHQERYGQSYRAIT